MPYTMKIDGDGVAFYGKGNDKPTEIVTMSGKTQDIPNGAPLYDYEKVEVSMWDAFDKEWRPQ